MKTSSRTKIVHAYKVYFPESSGGVVSIIRLLTTHLSSWADNEIVVARTRGLPRTDKIDGIAVKRSMSFGEIWSLPIAPLYCFLLRSTVQKTNVLALHSPFPLGDLVAAFFLPRRVRLIVHWHADIQRQSLLLPIIAPMIRRTLKRADQIVVSHQSIIESSNFLKPFRKTIEVVPFGIDADKWRILDADDRSAIAQIRKEHPRRLVAVGRLVSYKGFEYLINALVHVDADLIICGEGPYRPVLEKLVQALGLENRVSMPGYLTEREIKRILHASRALVLPSVTSAEAFGICQLEAMACSCGVINTSLATAVPHIARHGLEGITVPPRSIDELRAAIMKVLEDDEYAKRLGEAGSSRVDSSFSLKSYLARMKLIYAGDPPHGGQ